MRKRLVPSEESVDTLFQGRLAIVQGHKGYRFSLDAILLAHFAEVKGREKVIDLGAGNGVIPLVLAFFNRSAHVVGLEVQREMVGRARRSIALNRLGSRVEVIRGDVRHVEQAFPPGGFDAAVCNPPYRSPGSGRINPDAERRIARHEIMGSLKDFLQAGCYLLRYGGRMAMVYPATRALDLLEGMRQRGLEPKRLRWVHSFAASEASLILVEGVKGGRKELEVMRPLVLYAREKRYTAEIEAILERGISLRPFSSGNKR